ncbi:MAG: purine-nucleoside phosphorylase [Planctomycetaceae bacterium]|jgi:purine-nucleoside phosphorylase|nr:purine-nucleoside phosphorylase [Planctomycetaceae bacterium]
MLYLYDHIQEAAAFLRTKWNKTPHAGLILGTGLGNLASQIETDLAIPYDEIPYFSVSTSLTHKGQLVLGTLEGLPVMAMEGRVHTYEGYDCKQITFPVRVMRALGAELLIVSNACGGMNPQFAQGDVMLIEDHINLMGVNPLIGVNDDRLGPRFPDMCEPYSHTLIDKALEIARRENFAAQKGVYVGVLGPNLETRAEYRFMRTIGGDAVGMSTVPEVLVAIHSSMRVLGISIITDICFPDALNPANIVEIIRTANEAEPKLTKIVCGILAYEKTVLEKQVKN